MKARPSPWLDSVMSGLISQPVPLVPVVLTPDPVQSALLISNAIAVAVYGPRGEKRNG